MRTHGPGVTSLPDFKSAFPKWPSKDLATVVPTLDKAGVDLLAKMLCLDPTKRITARSALEHEYFKDIGTLKEGSEPRPSSAFEVDESAGDGRNTVSTAKKHPATAALNAAFLFKFSKMDALFEKEKDERNKAEESQLPVGKALFD
ncbi:hypothetical protein OIU77_021190 [Salix suchowensis]|uniref:Cyclin-dependent kinase n=1 Tax=Salix suchowensis TaxID=1278906 RepID=A0ABQ9C905_9ROSI|nr:hypothetical protein OIU77_021190 [Salix suchowensis]